jgi:hypothetical protein
MNPQALDALRDIHLPVPPAWWAMPEAWVAGACLAVAAVWITYRQVRYRLLRRSLRELAALETAHARDGDAVRLARGLSQLLRRHSAACFPDAALAGLAGRDWLAFLDAHCKGKAFTEGAGAALESLPYRASGEVNTRALIDVVRHWLRENPR